MEKTISQRELRNDSGLIMRRVEQGESFTVTRNGTPVADLVPHHAAASERRPRFVPVQDIGLGLTDLAPWGALEFAEDVRQLDVALDDRDLDPWMPR